METLKWHAWDLNAPSVPYIHVCRETDFLFWIPAGQTCGLWWQCESEGLCIHRIRHWNPAGTCDVGPKSRLRRMCYKKTQMQNYGRYWFSFFLLHCLIHLLDTRWQHITVFLLFTFQERKNCVFFFFLKVPGISWTESSEMPSLMSTKQMNFVHLQHIIRLLHNLICKVGIWNKRNHNNENVKSF